MRSLLRLSPLLLSVLLVAGAKAQPLYQIYDIGVAQTGDTASQGLRVSPGGIGVGRSFRSGATQAFSWTAGGGLIALPNIAGRNFCSANDANDNGIVVGNGATTAFGSGRLPLIWQNGAVSQLPLPAGQTIGDANAVNASTIAVGSVNSGSLQRGVIYNGNNATIISQTTSNGSYFLTAFDVSDSGRIVGQGIDPNNAAVNVGIVHDMSTGMTFSVGALPDFNGALAFGVSNAGHVVGGSMLNQGSALPFIWTEVGGMTAIPLPTGTSQGSARAVNSAGWAVGTASSAFAIPFLYDGAMTYRLADLIPADSGWDLSMNTSSSALGISDNRVIVGTGVRNGATRAYAMVPMLQLLAAHSRKTHGSAGTFDVPLALSGTPGVECRRGGPGGTHTIVLSFSNAVVSGTAGVTSGSGSVAGSPLFTGNTMTINLTGVGDVQTITITLSDVTDGFGQVLPSATVSASMLMGDINGNRTVNATDVGQVKSQSGATPMNANFRPDIDANGTVTATDIGIVKASAGNTLP